MLKSIPKSGWNLGKSMKAKFDAAPKKEVFRKEIRTCDRVAFYETICAVIELHMHSQLHNDFSVEEITTVVADDLQVLVDRMREPDFN